MHFSEISLILALFTIFSSVYTVNGSQEEHEQELLKTVIVNDKLNENLEVVNSDNKESNNPSSNETEDNDYLISNSTNPVNASVQLVCSRNKTVVPEPVEIVNASRLASLLQGEPNVTNRHMRAKCMAAFFYSAACPFSCKAAPHFNALAQYYPDIKMIALDAMNYKGFNAQYGIFGLPTLVLFHNGRPGVRLNESSEYNLKMFAKFLTSYTNIQPSGRLIVTSNDFKGPISPVPVYEKDNYLVLSWIVIVLQALYSFYRSSWGRWLVDITLSAWREAEAQYHHID